MIHLFKKKKKKKTPAVKKLQNNKDDITLTCKILEAKNHTDTTHR